MCVCRKTWTRKNEIMKLITDRLGLWISERNTIILILVWNKARNWYHNNYYYMPRRKPNFTIIILNIENEIDKLNWLHHQNEFFFIIIEWMNICKIPNNSFECFVIQTILLLFYFSISKPNAMYIWQIVIVHYSPHYIIHARIFHADVNVGRWSTPSMLIRAISIIRYGQCSLNPNHYINKWLAWIRWWGDWMAFYECIYTFYIYNIYYISLS